MTYIVRFNYGNEHIATYSGQDFKSTTCQVGIDKAEKQMHIRTQIKKEDMTAIEM